MASSRMMLSSSPPPPWGAQCGGRWRSLCHVATSAMAGCHTQSGAHWFFDRKCICRLLTKLIEKVLLFIVRWPADPWQTPSIVRIWAHYYLCEFVCMCVRVCTECVRMMYFSIPIQYIAQWKYELAARLLKYWIIFCRLNKCVIDWVGERCARDATDTIVWFRECMTAGRLVDASIPKYATGRSDR